MCGSAGWGTLNGLGPFAWGSRQESLVLLQLFGGAFALMTMFFSAAFAEWRQAEQQAILQSARRKAEERFRGLLESAPDAMVIVNQQGRIVLVNVQAERLFGYNRVELLEQPVELLVPLPERGVHARHRAGYYAHPTTRPMGAGLDLRGRRKDGSEFPLDISLSPLETEEGLLVTAAIRDTTEQKQAQALLRDLSGRLISLQEEERRRIARELHDSTSQVLAALMIDLNQLQANPAAQAEPVRPIVDEAVRLAEQSEKEIRTLSYLLHPPLLEELGLASALQEFGRGFSRRSGIQADVSVDEDGLDELPYEARLALFRIAQEGLTNVHRHSRSSTAQVQLRSDNDAIRLEVKDEGQGIPEEALQKIQRGVGAFGVGLLGMRDRLRQLGGWLEIESSRAGTTLRATIPRARSKT
jgi:PAS domain S-box-containing protein